MKFDILEMKESHRSLILQMMETFYHSPAVATDGSTEIYQADITACVSDSPYAQGYIFFLDNQAVGYGMLAKSFSTEFGRPCIWIEDLYLVPSARNQGLGSLFLQKVRADFPEAILRLEVEEENLPAMHTYKKNGYQTMDYTELYHIQDPHH